MRRNDQLQNILNIWTDFLHNASFISLTLCELYNGDTFGYKIACMLNCAHHLIQYGDTKKYGDTKSWILLFGNLNKSKCEGNFG